MTANSIQSANNNANNKEGANPSSSFQGKTKKAKSGSAAKKEENKSLIEKNLREGYDDYSKGEDLISLVAQRIVRGNDFSPKAIITEVEQTKKEKISELKSRYPGTFKDEDFSSNNIEKPSSGMIDTETQRTFRNLINETAKKSVISAKAIEELAGLEYFSEHIKGLEEKAKTGEIKKEGVAEEEAPSSLSSAPYIPLGALSHISTPHRAPMPSPASHTPSPSIPSPKISHILSSSPQAPQPSQGGGNQGGGMSVKSGVSSSASKTTSAPSAPAQTTPSTPVTSPVQTTPSDPTPQASQTTPETTPADAPLAQPQKNSAAPASPQTPTEPASAFMPAPSAQHQSPARTSQPKGEEEPAKDHQTKEIPTEPAPQEPTASQNMSESAPQTSPDQNPNISSGSLRQAPTPNFSPQANNKTSLPQSALPQNPSAFSQNKPRSQDSGKPTADNMTEEGGGKMPKKTIEEIKKAVEEKLKDSLEKNVDNGMGGIVVQDSARKSDADKIRMIKEMASQKDLNDQRNRISMINSAIKMDSARVDPANREAETQRIRKEAEKDMEKEIRKEIGGVKGRIASKVLSKIMGLAAYKMAQELSERANRGKDQLAFVIAFTLILAAAADFIDIKRDAVGAAFTVTIIGILFVVPWYLILLLISSGLTLFVNMFWMQLAGGGHSKLMWRFLIKTVLGITLNAVPIFGGIPFTVIIVLWNWYDFAKERRKAKQELKSFVTKNQALLRNVSMN